MAYNQRFNPDSLPAFAEPERRGNNQQPAAKPPPQQQQQQPSRYPPTSSQPAYINKPQPPTPMQPPPQHHGGRHSPQGPPQNQYNYGMSPPPASSGYGNAGSYGGGGGRPQGPPAPQPASRPQPVSRPPPSPTARDGGGDPALWPLFKAVDKDGRGKLTERELGSALVNGDWTSFDPHTVRMMIRMFDSDRDGTIGFEEFCGLWGFLAAWRSLFDRFDADRSGNISLDEYTNALVAFGYRLSPQFIKMLFRTFDKRNENAISFDLFVQSCITLKRMTDVFKKYDDDRDGFITLSFEDFLTEIIKQNL